jgi:hypothetical protein
MSSGEIKVGEKFNPVCHVTIGVQREPNPNDFGYLLLLHVALMPDLQVDGAVPVSKVVCIPNKATAPEMACYLRRFADAIEGTP